MDGPMGLRACLLALMGLASSVAFSVSGAAQTVSINADSPSGQLVTLSGQFKRPAGSGPFGGVVMLHGCAGIWKLRDDVWSDRLVSWGYVVLQVDSFVARGYPNGICQSPLKVSPRTRAKDAHAAKIYLSVLPYVDVDRIAVMGMSHGGWTTLSAIENSYLDGDVRAKPFRAAVALYPWCESPLYRLDAPLLILIGDADDWTFAFRCQRMEVKDPGPHEVMLKVYPGATHGFDVDQPDQEVLGHKIRYDAEAARDAVDRIRRFLALHLQGNR